MVKLKNVTETCWLVLSDDGTKQVGLLSEERENYILIADKVKTIFTGRDEVMEYFDEDVFDSSNVFEEDGKTVELFVNGYPVNFPTPHVDPQEMDTEYPLFTKTSKSSVRYAAGHYCVRFPKNWVSVCCPKLSTLRKYDHKGPYKLETEMQLKLNDLRRCRK